MILLEGKVNISALTEVYATRIIKEVILFEAAASSATINNDEKFRLTDWESIDNGLSGKLLFLLEVYHFSGEKKYLACVETAVQSLFVFCRNNPSGNFSLYTGRCGFIYTALQLYNINKDAQIIEQALEIIKPCNLEYLHGDYITDYLYNGRAGTLLVLFYLCHLSGAAFLPEYCGEFIKKIILNARCQRQGICWRAKDELNISQSCGFAKGAEGIRYVLNIINRDDRDSGLAFIIDEISRYRDFCWMEKKENWGNFERDILSAGDLEHLREAYRNNPAEIYEPADDLSWAGGTAGMLLSFYPGKKITPLAERAERRIESKLTVFIENNNYSQSLCNGLAGIGMYFLLSRSGEETEALAAIKEKILAETLLDSTLQGINEGLMHGGLGGAYFLLKEANGAKSPENILMPLAADAYFTHMQPGNLRMNYFETRRTLLLKVYPRSIRLLEIINSQIISLYCSEERNHHAADKIEGFTAFIQRMISGNSSDSTYLLLKDVFNFEKSKLSYFEKERRSNLQIYLHMLFLRDEALRYLNNTDEWLLNAEVVISDRFKIIKTQWDRSFQSDFKPVKTPGNVTQNFEYLLYVSSDLRQNEVPLKLSGLVIHQFDTPTTVRHAIATMKYFFQMQSLDALKEYAGSVGAISVKDFVNRLDYLILNLVRQLIYENIIIVKNGNS